LYVYGLDCSLKIVLDEVRQIKNHKSKNLAKYNRLWGIIFFKIRHKVNNEYENRYETAIGGFYDYPTF